MAVKFRLPDGSATDLLGQTSPRFPTDDPEVFVALTEATEKPLTLPLFLARHPGVLPSVAGQRPGQGDRLAGQLRRGDVLPDPRLRLARRRTAAAPGCATSSGRRPPRPTGWTASSRGRDRLAEEMAARLERGPVTHEVWVQVAGAGHDPHRATSVWSGARELLAGRIVVTATCRDPEGGPMSSTPDRLRPGPGRRRHRALRRPDPALPARRLLGVRVPARTKTSLRDPVKTLVIGTGGREHALARALARDPGVDRGARGPRQPGHGRGRDPARRRPAGRARGGRPRRLARRRPGRGRPGGTAGRRAWPTRCARAGIAAFGPSAEAARLEGSKAFAKEVMAAAGVPTARAFVCTTAEEAAAALDELGAPYVVKDDGLAAGKGVVVTDSRDEALAHAAALRTGGDRGVPRRPRGLAVRDHRRHAPSTRCSRPRTSSGSSTATRARTPAAWAPTRRCPWAPPGLVDEVLATVLQPTVDELARRGTPFSGLLYAGLALTSRGVRVDRVQRPVRRPRDPAAAGAARVAARRAADGRGHRHPRRRAAAGLRRRRRGRRGLASRGYPASSSSGDVITGVDVAEALDGRPRHPRRHRAAATATLVTAGGRVLAVVGTGSDVAAARAAAYAGVAEISFDGAQHRTDIAAAR